MKQKQMLLDLNDPNWEENYPVPDLRAEYRQGKKEYPKMDEQDRTFWNNSWRNIDEARNWRRPTPHEELCEKLDEIITLLKDIKQNTRL